MDTQRALSMAGSQPKCLQQSKLSYAEARSQELSQGFLHRWQGCHSPPPKVCVSRQLDLEAKPGSNPGTQMGEKDVSRSILILCQISACPIIPCPFLLFCTFSLFHKIEKSGHRSDYLAVMPPSLSSVTCNIKPKRSAPFCSNQVPH